MALASAYTARGDAYLFLLTETYPPFQEPQDAGPASPPAASAPPPPTA
jgi:hypothetical protein